MAFDGSQVVTTDRFVFFWKPPAAFSQWTRSHFTVDGVEYTHAEQFMMAEKARLFDDRAMLARILEAVDPSVQKKLGQAVRGFDEEVWYRERVDIVVRGNSAKFSQSDKLRRVLCDTGDRLLVEASPYDRIWGIGLRADDPRAADPRQWRGENLLGSALVAVRGRLCGG
ncbi:MAG: NADAR family protein [Planctomycetes bacterium]|nr:NADAR family protein [Planctomycetota bacterium]MCB9870205.1 NADAR family protein [Planctomycetota bacterium]MCB9888215.1 NADAR family protein [Planctomycetota bacterium]